jgi:hypothetical protein
MTKKGFLPALSATRDRLPAAGSRVTVAIDPDAIHVF